MSKQWIEEDWKPVRCNCGAPTCKRYGTDNGTFYQGCGYTLEEATLICAAPKLLSACEIVAGMMKEMGINVPVYLQEAIDKATVVGTPT